VIVAVTVHRGRYHDSVALMRASSAATDLADVDHALAAMATPLNRGLLADLGIDVDAEVDGAPPGPDDLVVAVRAVDAAAVAAAVAVVEAALAAPPRSGGAADAEPPRTIEAAARRLPAGAHGTAVALISVPGPSAFVEAMAALTSGLHVMVFSDGVPVEQEVALKAEAARRGLLVMGPDCGTAIVGGVGLGFANVVRPGGVGLVAASGTGAQQVCALLDAAGIGVRHVLGVGGRDLSSAVGGASTLPALAALDADPEVSVVVVVSKAPAPEVAERVSRAAAACTTPTVLAFVGPGHPSLTDSVTRIAAAAGSQPWVEPDWRHGRAPARRGVLVGLFSGGTNCLEALGVLEPVLGPIGSNIHPDHERRIPALGGAQGHRLVDLGDDELTVGRPHPMIDQRVLLDRLVAESHAADVGAIHLDVVLGHGAHPDPAAALAPHIADCPVPVVVTLVGTAGDPQGLERQSTALNHAGAWVMRSNASAAVAAASLASGAAP
jgi:FdrA protein